MSQQNSCGNCGLEGKTTIIYSCSGLGSNVGQLSNAAACRLTYEGFGNGSCLAGVGGSVEKLIGIGAAADRRVIKIKLIAIFVGILFVAITLTGLLFNAIPG